MVKNDNLFNLQGRTDLVWDATGQPIDTRTVFVAVAARQLSNAMASGSNTASSLPSSRIHIELNPARTSM